MTLFREAQTQIFRIQTDADVQFDDDEIEWQWSEDAINFQLNLKSENLLDILFDDYCLLPPIVYSFVAFNIEDTRNSTWQIQLFGFISPCWKISCNRFGIGPLHIFIRWFLLNLFDL